MWKVLTLDQLAVLKISLSETPQAKALEVESPLNEWAVKIDVSIPAKCNTVFNHLAIVDVETHCKFWKKLKVFDFFWVLL